MKSKRCDTFSYDEAKHLAFEGDAGQRRRVAEAVNIPPEILYKLAFDAVGSVRAAAAANPDVPDKALPDLAGDNDDSVRAATCETVIERVRDSLGTLAAPVQDALRRLVVDPVVSIRQRLSEGLSDSPHTPPDIAEALARDEEASVAIPMLHGSPVLSDTVLIEIVHETDDAHRREAIISRAHLSGDIIDAIVIEDTPMPLLNLAPSPSRLSQQQQRAWDLYTRQELSESIMAEAIQQRDRLFIISALALLTQTREGKVKKMFALQGGKAITALAWKAGLSASIAYQLQVLIAGIAHRQALAPRHGDYALSPSELEWQLELFDSLVA